MGGIFGTVVGAGVAASGSILTLGTAAVPAWALGVGTTLGITALTEGLAMAAREAVSGIGSSLPDQIYLEVGDTKLWPTDKAWVEVKEGSIVYPNVTIPRKGKEVTIRLKEHDVVLDADLLAEIKILDDFECVAFPVLTPNTEEN
jgi:hypothetical protein